MKYNIIKCPFCKNEVNLFIEEETNQIICGLCIMRLKNEDKPN